MLSKFFSRDGFLLCTESGLLIPGPTFSIGSSSSIFLSLSLSLFHLVHLPPLFSHIWFAMPVKWEEERGKRRKHQRERKADGEEKAKKEMIKEIKFFFEDLFAFVAV